MRIKYHDNCLESNKAEKINYKAFAEIFGLKLHERFVCVEDGNYAHEMTFKITEQGPFEWRNGKWERTCNFEGAILKGYLRFK